MTTRTMARRVDAVEADMLGENWRHYRARPMDEWPDEALTGFLRATVPGLEGEGPLSDDVLRQIAAKEDIR